MHLNVPIGIDDFQLLRERKLVYVDKSFLIRDLIDSPGLLSILFPRPRRFGKTLNLSMLRCFFDIRSEKLWHLFDNLAIARAGHHYTQHFARYPVIFLSLKGVKASDLNTCQHSLRALLSALVNQYPELFSHPALNPWEHDELSRLRNGSASDAAFRRSLLFLCECLFKVYHERVIILIDEYDAPIHSAFLNGFFRPMLDFFRDFFELSLKGNPFLHLAVITGVLRVAKESIFSGLNNLGVFSVLSSKFRDAFGFGEDEVAALFEQAGIRHRLDEARAYYNGYSFGGHAIYNPWSILKFLEDGEHRLIPHWLGTSSNDLTREVLETHAQAVKDDLEILLAGGSIEKAADEYVSLEDIRTNPNSLWSLLAFTGYLKAWYAPESSLQWNPPVQLAIPNAEIFEIYRSTFRAWLDRSLQAQGGSIDRLLRALLSGNAQLLEEQLQHYARQLLSYHDTAYSLVQPERFYHGLLLGLLASLEPIFKVRSNRESGAGRPDILILPTRDAQPGAVLELKVVSRGKSRALLKPAKIPAATDKILKAALEQISTKHYAEELKAAHASPIHLFAVAFDGKYVWVKGQTLDSF